MSSPILKNRGSRKSSELFTAIMWKMKVTEAVMDAGKIGTKGNK
jgi:hypothetical protein